MTFLVVGYVINHLLLQMPQQVVFSESYDDFQVFGLAGKYRQRFCLGVVDLEELYAERCVELTRV